MICAKFWTVVLDFGEGWSFAHGSKERNCANDNNWILPYWYKGIQNRVQDNKETNYWLFYSG